MYIFQIRINRVQQKHIVQEKVEIYGWSQGETTECLLFILTKETTTERGNGSGD